MQPKLILQLETATTSCSVALAYGGNLLAVKEVDERNIHASHLTLFIEEVMKQAGKVYADLDAVAISKGPGSYTGLRIGVSTAKGLCFALDIPLIAVNTLESMASGILNEKEYAGFEGIICPMIDARRMEVYTALFTPELEQIEPVQAKILNEHSFDKYLQGSKVLFLGDGAEKCKPLYAENKNALFADFRNSASHLSKPAYRKFLAGEFEDLAYFEPFYLKDFIAGAPIPLAR